MSGSLHSRLVDSQIKDPISYVNSILDGSELDYDDLRTALTDAISNVQLYAQDYGARVSVNMASIVASLPRVKHDMETLRAEVPQASSTLREIMHPHDVSLSSTLSFQSNISAKRSTEKHNYLGDLETLDRVLSRLSSVDGLLTAVSDWEDVLRQTDLKFSHSSTVDVLDTESSDAEDGKCILQQMAEHVANAETCLMKLGEMPGEKERRAQMDDIFAQFLEVFIPTLGSILLKSSDIKKDFETLENIFASVKESNLLSETIAFMIVGPLIADFNSNSVENANDSRTLSPLGALLCSCLSEVVISSTSTRELKSPGALSNSRYTRKQEIFALCRLFQLATAILSPSHPLFVRLSTCSSATLLERILSAVSRLLSCSIIGLTSASSAVSGAVVSSESSRLSSHLPKAPSMDHILAVVEDAILTPLSSISPRESSEKPDSDVDEYDSSADWEVGILFRQIKAFSETISEKSILDPVMQLLQQHAGAVVARLLLLHSHSLQAGDVSFSFRPHPVLDLIEKSTDETHVSTGVHVPMATTSLPLRAPVFADFVVRGRGVSADLLRNPRNSLGLLEVLESEEALEALPLAQTSSLRTYVPLLAPIYGFLSPFEAESAWIGASDERTSESDLAQPELQALQSLKAFATQSNAVLSAFGLSSPAAFLPKNFLSGIIHQSKSTAENSIFLTSSKSNTSQAIWGSAARLLPALLLLSGDALAHARACEPLLLPVAHAFISSHFQFAQQAVCGLLQRHSTAAVRPLLLLAAIRESMQHKGINFVLESILGSQVAVGEVTPSQPIRSPNDWLSSDVVRKCSLRLELVPGQNGPNGTAQYVSEALLLLAGLQAALSRAESLISATISNSASNLSLEAVEGSLHGVEEPMASILRASDAALSRQPLFSLTRTQMLSTRMESLSHLLDVLVLPAASSLEPYRSLSLWTRAERESMRARATAHGVLENKLLQSNGNIGGVDGLSLHDLNFLQQLLLVCAKNSAAAPKPFLEGPVPVEEGYYSGCVLDSTEDTVTPFHIHSSSFGSAQLSVGSLAASEPMGAFCAGLMQLAALLAPSSSVLKRLFSAPSQFVSAPGTNDKQPYSLDLCDREVFVAFLRTVLELYSLLDTRIPPYFRAGNRVSSSSLFTGASTSFPPFVGPPLDELVWQMREQLGLLSRDEQDLGETFLDKGLLAVSPSHRIDNGADLTAVAVEKAFSVARDIARGVSDEAVVSQLLQLVLVFSTVRVDPKPDVVDQAAAAVAGVLLRCVVTVSQFAFVHSLLAIRSIDTLGLFQVRTDVSYLIDVLSSLGITPIPELRRVFSVLDMDGSELRDLTKNRDDLGLYDVSSDFEERLRNLIAKIF